MHISSIRKYIQKKQKYRVGNTNNCGWSKILAKILIKKKEHKIDEMWSSNMHVETTKQLIKNIISRWKRNREINLEDFFLHSTPYIIINKIRRIFLYKYSFPRRCGTSLYKIKMNKVLKSVYLGLSLNIHKRKKLLNLRNTKKEK